MPRRRLETTPEARRVVIEHVGDEEEAYDDPDDATAQEEPPIGPDYDARSDDDGGETGEIETEPVPISGEGGAGAGATHLPETSGSSTCVASEGHRLEPIVKADRTTNPYCRYEHCPHGKKNKKQSVVRALCARRLGATAAPSSARTRAAAPTTRTASTSGTVGVITSRRPRRPRVRDYERPGLSKGARRTASACLVSSLTSAVHPPPARHLKLPQTTRAITLKRKSRIRLFGIN
jgi:hypothetical protein